MQPVDRSLSIGDRASGLMRTYSRTASPRAYELWYTYVTGLNPTLNAAVKRALAAEQALESGVLDALYEAHISSDRLSVRTEKTSGGLLLELEQVMGLIEAALGSTAQYGASLEALSSDLREPVERRRLRDIVDTMVEATRTVAVSNQELETRLRDSRGEIQALKVALEEVRIESLTDPLTGLANRKQFEMTLTSSVARAKAESSALVLLMIDIDHFKRFNDSYGHLTGDQVLRLVAVAMRDSVEGGSRLARFGGEEFAIIIPDARSADALSCAEKIRRNVMSRELLRRSTGESLGRVTVSLGLATLRPDDSANSFLERADLCMYRAKEGGRNRIVSDRELFDHVSTAA